MAQLNTLKQKISVIVPVYRVEQYLKKCVNSILAQTYTNLEIILVDDGSPDHCPEICDSYAERDPRVKVIHKTNGGLSDARNAGLAIASGALIGFVDSDDWLEPTMYEKLMQILVETGADIAECKNIRFENGRLQDCGSDGSTVVWNREEALDRLFEDKLVRSYAWDKLYRKALWKDIRFPKGKYYEDIFIMHKVFEKANKVVFLKKGLYYYRIRSGSVMHSDDMELAMDRLHSLEVRYSSDDAKGREKYAPAQFFYSVQTVQRKLYMLHLPWKLKRKYRKEINTYALKYCKGSTLTKKDLLIKWLLILSPALFFRILNLHSSDKVQKRT